MNELEREKIQEVLPKLLKEITCSDEFLVHFVTGDVITASEKDSVYHQRIYQQDATVHKSYFLNIIQTRVNGFNVLINALKETNQDGALKLLKPNEAGSSSSKTGCDLMTSIVIGTTECSFRDIMDQIIDSSVNYNLTSNWRRLATLLDISLSDTQRYQQKINMGVETEIDVIEKMLHQWKSAKSNEATLGALINILESKALDCKGVADNLRKLC